MAQLSLNITPCLPYAPDGFVLHQGVVAAFEHCLSIMSFQGFRVVLISAGPRCGKTHFSIKLADVLLSQGSCPRLLEGSELQQWLEQQAVTKFTHEDAVVVDNAHLYLDSLAGGRSGAWVDFVERLRIAGSALVLLSLKSLDELICDEHVKSRLAPGAGIKIGSPGDGDMLQLLLTLARQRGIALGTRQAEFLVKRLARNIPALEAYLDRLVELARATGKPIRFPMLGDAV